VLISEFPLMPAPPAPPATLDEPSLSRYFAAVERWQRDIAMFIDIRERLTDDSVNGQIEWPTPFVLRSTGNIKAHYACINVELVAPSDDANLIVPHSLGVIPRFWWAIIHSPAGHTASVSDRVVGSDDQTPLASPGHPLADVDGSDGTIIYGTDLSDAWISNGVAVGDLLKLAGDPSWHTVQAITTGGGGAPDFVTLQEPTSLALGTTGVQYVFRRAGDRENIYARVVADGPSLVVATLVVV